MIPRPPRSTLFPTRRSSDLLADLDQQHAFAGPGQEIDFVRLRKESSPFGDRKSTRLNSSHRCISYAVFCLKKKKNTSITTRIFSMSYPYILLSYLEVS